MDKPAITRKKFIIQTIASATGIILAPALVYPQQKTLPAESRGSALDNELVKEFVVAGHKDLDKVKTMLQETPDLLNASYNWKLWDWEDAIGGAGHVGS